MISTSESQHAHLVTILDGLPIAVMLRAPDGTLLHINPGGERFLQRLGVGVDAIYSSPSSLMDHVQVVDEAGRPHEVAALPVVSAIRDVAEREAIQGYGLPTGGYAWYRTRAAPVVLSGGAIGTVVTVDDITEQQEARHRLTVAERSLRLTFDHAPIGIAILRPDGSLLEANTALCDLLGVTEAHLMADGLQWAAHPDERDHDGDLLATWLSGSRERHVIDRRLPHVSGGWLSCQLSVAVVRDNDGTPLHLIVQVVDLTARHALEQELRAAATEDPLTGLANRRALSEELDEAQRRQERDGSGVGLLYVDLDDFKTVNDTYGHDVGDRVLVETGRRLRGVMRDDDTVCRMGGDEFVVLCAPVEGPLVMHRLEARLASMLPVTVMADGRPVTVRASTGSVVVAPEEDLDDALRRADAAMYRSKAASRMPT
ncbi:diguanylate cyclase domain-containing protein [Aquipuribacter sp. MA13-6]|uniref:diguanylate cyclase domain-containing protein n=1 Tax=unclassified Aquipuribacter TaxID=2635084 RepID=UPI003EF05929